MNVNRVVRLSKSIEVDEELSGIASRTKAKTLLTRSYDSVAY